MDTSQQEIYREILIEHSQSPRNRGEPVHYSATVTHKDPESGDIVTLWLLIEGDVIQSLHWQAQGSSVLTASCSILCENLERKSPAEAQQFITLFVEMLTQQKDPDNWDTLGDAAALSGIRHLPARVRCAVLPWRTAESLLK